MSLNAALALRIRDIVAEHFGIGAELIEPETRFCELDADPLDMVELTCAIEEALDCELDDEAMHEATTVSDVIALVLRSTTRSAA